MIFAVVTAVGKYPGNHAVGPIDDMWLDGQFTANHKDVRLADDKHQAMLLLALREPVFTKGEIVILDGEYGRELVGAQRKPSKWDVTVEHFDNIEDAVRCAQELV